MTCCRFHRVKCHKRVESIKVRVNALIVRVDFMFPISTTNQELTKTLSSLRVYTLRK